MSGSGSPEYNLVMTIIRAPTCAFVARHAGLIPPGFEVVRDDGVPQIAVCVPVRVATELRKAQFQIRKAKRIK